MPLIVTVPVEIEIISFLELVDAPMVRDPAVRDPAPTAIVQVIPLEGLGIDIRPLTDRVFDPEIVTELDEVTAAKVNVLQTAAMSTVTVIPELIVTTSPATGTALPPQVAVLLQFPEEEAVLAADQASPAPKRITVITIRRKYSFFIISVFSVINLVHSAYYTFSLH